MEDGRNAEPKVTSVEQFELRRQAKAQEAQQEELAKFFKTKRALFHSGYQTCSPEAQECDRKVLNVHADKVTRGQREAKLLERYAHVNSNQPQKQQSLQKAETRLQKQQGVTTQNTPNRTNQPQKQQSQGIER